MIRITGLFMFVCYCFSGYSQNEDALLWTSTSVKGKINRDFNYEFDLQFRLDENMSNLSSALLQGTIDYEIGKLFKLTAGYRLTNNNEAYNYQLNSRLFTDLDFEYELVKDFDLEIRMRAQHDYDRLTALNDYILPNTRTLLRFKYGLQYKLKDCKPSVSNELFFNPTSSSLTRYRFNFGLGYEISKRHSLKIGYTFEKNMAATRTTEHIYKVGYAFDIPGKIFSKR